MKTLFRAWAFFKSDLVEIGFGFGLLVLGVGANLLKPWPLALIVDSVIGTKPLPGGIRGWFDRFDKPGLLALLVLIMCALHAGQGALTAWQNYVTIRVGLRGLARVRNALFTCLQRLSLRFHQGRQQGDVIYRATWDTYSFQTMFQQGVFTLVTALLSLVLMLAVMWGVNRPLTLLSLVTVPMLLMTMRFFGGEMSRRSLAAHQADSQLATMIQQNIVALPLVQSYTREEHEQKRFAEQTEQAFRKRAAQHGWEVAYWLMIAVVFGIGTAAIAWVGSNQVQLGRLTVGQLLIFLAYLGQLYEPLNQLSRVGTTVADAGAGIQRVFEILDSPEEVSERPGARRIVVRARAVPWAASGRASAGPDQDRAAAVEVHGAISFEGVSFGYEPGRLVLRKVSFRLEAGESAALIGPSGAGKTTLLQLLPRFYDPVEGVIRLDEFDLRDLRLRDLRAQIALVPQVPLLLAATVAENIAYGRPEASLDEIEAAARAAHADEFIRALSQQYQTILGEGGARLSAGETQRISIARAFLKDAPVLILDEPTSALDADNERWVLQSMEELMRGRTTLMVAHRLATVQRAPRVLVLKNGELSEGEAVTG